MKPSGSTSTTAFTLIEVMVATTIVVILTGILISATDMTAKSFARTSAKIEQFSESRRGFEVMTRRLAEATLNTYWDYFDANGKSRPAYTGPTDPNFAASKAFVPTKYGRQSDLRFCSGPMTTLDPSASGKDRPTHGIFFQAPVGEVEDRDKLGILSQTLNCWGYFLEIGDDKEYIPKLLQGIVKSRVRSRLLEFRQPTERNLIYFPVEPTANPKDQSADKRNWWFIHDIDQATDRPVRVVSENVIALVLVPRLSRSDEIARAAKFGAGSNEAVLCPDYKYDSTSEKTDAEINPKNQLPPVIQVVMVALDEASASKLAERNGDKPGFGLDLDQTFKRSARLEDDLDTPAANDGELSELEKKLIDLHLTYRIFNTNVIIRGAKWSRAQTAVN